MAFSEARSIFQKSNLKDTFFQINLKGEDKMKKAFRIKNRTYEWNRMLIRQKIPHGTTTYY
jgi:hypothetical protein